MNYKMIGRFFAAILAIEAAFMLPAIAVSLIYHESSVAVAYVICIAALLCSSAFLYFFVKKRGKTLLCKRGSGLCRPRLAHYFRLRLRHL